MRQFVPVFLFLLIISPLFSSAPGEIVSIELERTMTPGEIDDFNAPLFKGFDQPEARYSVDVYWVKYYSLYPDDEPAIITSQMFIPRFDRRDSRSVYVFGAGSTGLRDSCRPSREHIMGISWGLYRSHVLAHAGQGSIGILPDYMGFGDPERLQYYMVALCEARVMLDGIRALKNAVSKLGIETIGKTSHFVSGFSQGGHAAFAAADYRASYAPEISLNGVIGYGPTTDIFSLFREYSDIAPMVLFTFSRLYGEDKVDPAQILLSKYSENLERDLLRMCVGGMQSYYPQIPKGLFKEDFIDSLLNKRISSDYPSLYRFVQMNSTGLSGQRTPTVIYQGGNDIVIHPETQNAFVEELQKKGVPVDYVFYENARHDTRQISFSEARTWIENHTD